MEISPGLADSLTAKQLDTLIDRRASTGHTARWLETSEQKWWMITGHARQISADRILVWTHTDESGTADVELVVGTDPLAAAIDHAHNIACGLHGLTQYDYAIRIVKKWENESEEPKPVTS